MDIDIDTLPDGDIIRLCAINITVDPSCTCLLSGGAPQLNTDLAGPGVRISFYLQALFLALLSLVSEKEDEKTNTLYSIIVLNIAVPVAVFFMEIVDLDGRQMSVQDAIVVTYLLFITWTATSFAFQARVRIRMGTWGMGLVSWMLYMLQSVNVLCFMFIFFIVAKDDVGPTPRCNSHAVAAFFKPIPMLAARNYAFVVVALMFMIFLLLIFHEMDLLADLSRYTAEFGRRIWKIFAPNRHVPGMKTGNGHRFRIAKLYHVLADTEHGIPDSEMKSEAKDGKPKPRHFRLLRMRIRSLLQLSLVILLWTAAVVNTELLVKWNRFDGGGNGPGLGIFGSSQILAMFPVILPFIDVIKVFVRRIRAKKKHRKPARKARKKGDKASLGSATHKARRRKGTHDEQEASQGASQDDASGPQQSQATSDKLHKEADGERDEQSSEQVASGSIVSGPVLTTSSDSRDGDKGADQRETSGTALPTPPASGSSAMS